VTARLIVRRVRDLAKTDELFPVWRHHPLVTNSVIPAPEADIIHRRHASVETVFADLIDRSLAHLPSGSFSANSTWAIGAQISRNLLRATDTLTSAAHAMARGATLRRQLLNVPARLALPQGKATLHLPEHWPWANTWTQLWQQVLTPRQNPTRASLTVHPPTARPEL